MNGETLFNLYVVVVVIGIVLIFWGLITLWKRPQGHAKILSTSQENITGLGAFMLAFCSVGLSIGFALILSTSFFIGVLFVSLFAGFGVAEFTASFHLAKAWNDRKVGLVVAAGWLLVGGVLISIIAGQAMIAQKVEEAEAKRLQASEAYQQALQARKQAEEQVKRLAIDNTLVTQAQEKLARFESDLAALQAQREQVVQRRNACQPNHLTKCINPANTEIATLDTKLSLTQGVIEKEQAILSQFNQYQNAKSYLGTLQNQPLPATVKADATLPGIRALSIVLSIPPETVASHVFLFLAVFGELSSIILFYLWGASRLERSVVERTVAAGITIDGEFSQVAVNSNQDIHQQLARIKHAQQELEKSLEEQMALLEAKESTTTKTTSPKP
jgi:hypothetical protein